MKLAYNPKTAAAITTAPANDDITFDLKGLNIFVKGEKFKGTDTTYSVFKKHTSSDNKGGYNGLVPVPSYSTTNNRFLREDGTWLIPSTVYTGLSNLDLNTLTTEGKWYYAPGGNTTTNKPGDAAGYELYVGRNASGYRYLKAIDSTGLVWYRPYAGSKWGSWIQWKTTDLYVLQSVSNTTNFRPLVFGYTSTTDTTKLESTTTLLVYVSNKIYAQTSTGSLYATTFKGELSGTIASATTAVTLATTDNSTKVATTAFVKAALTANLTTTDGRYVKKAGDTMTGSLIINNSITVSNGALLNGGVSTPRITMYNSGFAEDGVRPETGVDAGGIRGTMAANDQWAIFGYGTKSDAGYLEIATGDNGNEPIYCGQYASGAPFSAAATRIHGITLMDATGNQVFNTVTATGYKKSGSSDSYVLLGGGGHKLVSDFMLKTDILTNNLTTIQKTLTVTQEWMDTGITGPDLATGTYIVLVYVAANNGTGLMYNCYSSGVMSWYYSNTNDNESDEILLHRSGHAYGKVIYLRTLMSASPNHLRLLISANLDIGAEFTYTFKFKRII